MINYNSLDECLSVLDSLDVGQLRKMASELRIENGLLEDELYRLRRELRQKQAFELLVVQFYTRKALEDA